VRTLLDDQYAPITSDVGFLELPVERVANGLLAWMRRNGRNAEEGEVSEAFPEILRRLEPLRSGIPTRELVLETRSSWTAYFANGIGGGDPTTPVSYLSRTLGCRGVTARAMPHTVDLFEGRCGRHGSLQFQLFGPRRTEFLNYVRTIDLTHDGSAWQFSANGEPQPYETTEQYRARRKTDRFTSEMLESYCRALGIELFEPSFYGPRGVLISSQPTSTGPETPPVSTQIDGIRVRVKSDPIEIEELALADVQRRHCIGPAAQEMLATMRRRKAP